MRFVEDNCVVAVKVFVRKTLAEEAAVGEILYPRFGRGDVVEPDAIADFLAEFYIHFLCDSGCKGYGLFLLFSG